MTTEELRRAVGITRDTLYYLEYRGYITPKKTRVGDRFVRDYSQRDADIVRIMWHYHHQQDLSYMLAYEKALQDLQKPQLALGS
jgi:DNA-binding transcriptional MerR regulator